MTLFRDQQSGVIRSWSLNRKGLFCALSTLIGYFVIGMTLSGCTGSHQVSAPETESAAAPQDLFTTQTSRARQAIANGALLIDVRTPAEFNDRHLENAVNIPLSLIAERIASIEPNRSRAIVVYCNRGHRGEAARVRLEGLGYGEVINGGGLEDF
jgi:phage shock protein E